MSLEDGDFYFFKGTSLESAKIKTWWVGILPEEKGGGRSPTMSPW